MLWMVSGPNFPNIFYKSSTKEDVIALWHKGFTAKAWNERYDPATHPEIKIEQITSLEKFLEIVPEEFKIDEDGSF